MKTNTTTRSTNNRSNMVGLHQLEEQVGSEVVGTDVPVVSLSPWWPEQHGPRIAHHEDTQVLSSVGVSRSMLVVVAFPVTFTTL
jgi:hypothetical protein